MRLTVHMHANTCAPLQRKRMWLRSPLCVSPPAWQMHLLSKSWWIYRLNSKSKPHFRSPHLRREPLAPAVPSTSASNHSLTKLRWKKASLRILILATCWVGVMNGNKMLSCLWTPHMGCFLTFLRQNCAASSFRRLSGRVRSVSSSRF